MTTTGDCELLLEALIKIREKAHRGHAHPDMTDIEVIANQAIRQHETRADARAVGELAFPRDDYVIETLEHNGTLALWWKPSRQGYTTNLDEAGVYSLAEAEAIERLRPPQERKHRLSHLTGRTDGIMVNEGGGMRVLRVVRRSVLDGGGR